jgi:hypothetical protein
MLIPVRYLLAILRPRHPMRVRVGVMVVGSGSESYNPHYCN